MDPDDLKGIRLLKLLKQEGVVTLVKHPSRGNSTHLQHGPIW